MRIKSSDLKELSMSELLLREKELREELFHLRRKNALKQLADFKSIKKTRENLARVLTIINDKKKKGEEDEGKEEG